MSKRLFAIVLAALLVFLAVSLISDSPADGPGSSIFPRPVSSQNLCGPAGAVVASFLLNACGLAAYAVLIPLVFGTVIFGCGRAVDQLPLRLLGMSLVLSGVAACCAFALTGTPFDTAIGPGGYLGSVLQFGLSRYFSPLGCYILLSSLILAGAVLACDYSIIRLGLWVFGIAPIGQDILQRIKDRRESQEQVRTGQPTERIRPKAVQRTVAEPYQETISPDFDGDAEEDSFDFEMGSDSDDTEFAIEERVEEEAPPQPAPSIFGWLKLGSAKKTEEPDEPESEDEYDFEEEAEEQRDYALPQVELLTESTPFNYEVLEATIKRQAKQLEKAFADFGFNIRVVEIQTGPVIAQFEIQLERGLRLSKIQNLTDDLAIALKVPSVRIVAPIPGKNTVGIEIPNEERQLVRLREVIEETTETAESMYIPIFLGKDVSGSAMVIDLTKLPHLLIAGRTGTGKSVCLNSIIVSMLMTRKPEEVRMLLIDPKMVELSPYKTIPHLMHPVVTDMKKAEAILGWAVEKMEQRYQLLARAGVRQLSEYNKLTETELRRRLRPESEEEWGTLPRKLPYLVIVADEMADLMMTSAKEVETHIIRLAQKSRAVGIHLVLATQKPTVDILTGLIKSNLPARIAFEVASRSDSQVVLDRNGAEKLLGNGDLLFLKPGTSQVLRGQGTYVSDQEIEGIIAEIGTEAPEYVEELVSLKIEGEEEELETTSKGGGRDDLYEKAVEFVIREGRGSLSLLQRKLKIGYSRAARLIDFMFEDGVVGEYNGSNAREVITTLHDWRKRREGVLVEPPRPAAVSPVAPVPSVVVAVEPPRRAAKPASAPAPGPVAAPPRPAAAPKSQPAASRVVPMIQKVEVLLQPQSLPSLRLMQEEDFEDEFEEEEFEEETGEEYEEYDEEEYEDEECEYEYEEEEYEESEEE